MFGGILGDQDSATPLMQVITYLLIAEAAGIIFLSLPFQIKFRRTLAELLVTSPMLSTLRIVFLTICGFLSFLLVDNVLRLQRVHARKPIDLFTAENLYSQRNRLQRDLFVLAFTLFCAIVLYQIQLLLLRMGRYRKQRNALADQVRSLGAEPVRVHGLEGTKGGKVVGGKTATAPKKTL
ncbi:hypothetical protein PhCBS80983_g00091 [Powellomyces hirtus]|uniref:Endoplasmic reticulum transmembrane protein n=1 Tax=Powellomyces hirtus TaxID=109895 RepID=A0A507EI51_9FUNG|nr:hypothetical protein PhCBS80983_g00091 [Powellomyces hirtus]